MQKGILKGGIVLKKKNMISKKDKKSKIMVFIYIISFIVCNVADYILDKEVSPNNNLLSIMYSAIITIAGIWGACYLLFIELYKDKYPIEIIRDTYITNIKSTFFNVIFVLLIGIWALVFNGIITSIWFILFSLFTIIEVLFFVYNCNKSLMTETHISDFCCKICSELENYNNSISDDSIKKIKDILNECVLKDEYRTVSSIVERTAKIFRSFLENSLKLASNEKADSINESFEKIVELNLYQLRCCSQIKSEILIDKIVKQQYKNLIYCVKNKLYDRYKIYFEEYCGYVYSMQKDGNDILVDKFYTVFSNIHIYLITKNNNDEEYIKLTVNSVQSLISSLVFTDKNSNTKGYLKYLTTVILEALGTDSAPYFNSLLEQLKYFSYIVLRNKYAFDKLKVYYTILFHKILEKDCEKALSFFEEIFNSSTINTDTTFIEFELSCIDELQHNMNEPSNVEKLLEMHVLVIEEIIKLKSTYTGGLLLPDFKTIIISCQYASNDVIANKINNIKKLLNTCIIRDNVAAFYLLLDRVIEIFAITEQRQKALQEELFDIYFWLIRRCNSLVNEQFQEVLFSALRETIEKLDRNKAVSKNMAKFIIKGLHKSAENDIISGHKTLSRVIDLFFGFFDEKNQIYFVTNQSSNEIRKLVYKVLFNIGTDCIENNYEIGVRNVSNSFGWLTIDCLENHDFESAKYIIERALDLFDLSKKMLISEKTLTFLLTLFTTVGTFCCKNTSFFSIRKKIIKGICKEDITKINTAIQLRTTENEGWNKIFDNRTAELTKLFIEEFKRIQSEIE